MIRFADIVSTPSKAIPFTPSPIPFTPDRPLDSVRAVKLAAARVALAEIGAPAIDPPPLVDTTKRRGGRRKLTGEAAVSAKEVERKRRREWMAVRRAAAKAG